MPAIREGHKSSSGAAGQGGKRSRQAQSSSRETTPHAPAILEGVEYSSPPKSYVKHNPPTETSQTGLTSDDSVSALPPPVPYSPEGSVVHSVSSGPYLDPPSDFGDTPRGGTKNGNLPVRMGAGPERLADKNGYQNLPALDPQSPHYISNNNNNNNNNSMHGRVKYSAVAGVLRAFNPPFHADTITTTTTATISSSRCSSGLAEHAQSMSAGGLQLSDEEQRGDSLMSNPWYSTPEPSPEARKHSQTAQVEITVQSPSGKYAELAGQFSPTPTLSQDTDAAVAAVGPTPTAVPLNSTALSPTLTTAAVSPTPTALLSPIPTAVVLGPPPTLRHGSAVRGVYDHLERKNTKSLDIAATPSGSEGVGVATTPSGSHGVGVATGSQRHCHSRGHKGSRSFDAAEVVGSGNGESTSRGRSLPPSSNHTHSLSQPVDLTHQHAGHLPNPSWNLLYQDVSKETLRHPLEFQY